MSRTLKIATINFYLSAGREDGAPESPGRIRENSRQSTVKQRQRWEHNYKVLEEIPKSIGIKAFTKTCQFCGQPHYQENSVIYESGSRIRSSGQ